MNRFAHNVTVSSAKIGSPGAILSSKFDPEKQQILFPVDQELSSFGSQGE